MCVNLLLQAAGQPTIATHEWKDQESSSFSVPQGRVSQLVFCLCWDPKEVSSNAREGVDVLTRQGQAVEQSFLLPLSLYTCPPKSVAQIKFMHSCLKFWMKGMCHPASRSSSKAHVFQTQDLDHKHTLYFWIVVHSRYFLDNNQE